MANSMNDPQGVELPGVASSGGLSWQEVDASQGLELDMSQLPPPGVSMGGDFAAVVPLTQDTDSQFGNVELFPDTQPVYDVEPQWDSMSGVPTDSHTETLAQEQVYGMAPPLPFTAVPETANPIEQGDL